jgi:polysaccharide pyruvyl transferase CsaB
MTKSGKTFTIGISGSYGGLNLGDEAILESIITQMRENVSAEITVFSRNPQDTLKRHRVEHAMAVRKMSRDEISPEIEKLDLFILGGGGILYDSEARQYLREAEIAAELKVPFMVYAVGVGPLEDTNIQAMVRDVLNQASAITVREKTAKQLLETSGVRNEIIVTADPAFLLSPAPLPENALEQEGLAGKKGLVAMSVREPGGAAPDMDQDSYIELLANAADFMVDRFDTDIVFIPMERGEVKDIQYSHAVISKMYFANRAQVLQQVYPAGQMLSFFEHFSFAVGMRMHFLIFSALQGVPFVALPYAAKVSGILESMGIDMPLLQVVTAGKLAAYIDRSWDNRGEVRRLITERLPALQQAARRNNEIAVDLLDRHVKTGKGG